MTVQNLDEILLSIRVNDSVLAATALPEDLKVFSKMFARTLGDSSGKSLLAYEEMFRFLYSGESSDKVKRSIRRLVNSESKIEVDVPFLGPKRARNCGLVTLNYTGFFDAEVELYSALLQDQIQRDHLASDDILGEIRAIAKANPARYSQLLEQKQQAIYDFGVLMGINSDQERFDQLTEDLPQGMVKYFRFVSKAHRGGLLRPSWPLPFNKFSESIQRGLYFDTVSYELQEELNADLGFVNPNTEHRQNRVKEIFDEVKSLIEKSSLNQTEDSHQHSLIARWQTLSVVPVAALYFSGLGSQLTNLGFEQKPGFAEQYPVFAATVTALASAFCCDGEFDWEQFTGCWTTAYSTLIPSSV